MFDGKIRQREVRASVQKKGHEKQEFIEITKRQREGRQLERLKNKSATVIQAQIRKLLSKLRVMADLRNQFDSDCRKIDGLKSVFLARSMTFSVPVATIQKLLRSLIFFYSCNQASQARNQLDINRLHNFICLLTESLHSTTTEYNILSTILTFDTTLTRSWQFEIQKLCCIIVRRLCFPDSHTDITSWNLLLNSIISLAFFTENDILLHMGMIESSVNKLKEIQSGICRIIFKNELCLIFHQILSQYSKHNSNTSDNMNYRLLSTVVDIILAALQSNNPCDSPEILATKSECFLGCDSATIEAVWYCLTMHVLSTPSLTSVTATAPTSPVQRLLSTLVADSGRGWSRALAVISHPPNSAISAVLPKAFSSDSHARRQRKVARGIDATGSTVGLSGERCNLGDDNILHQRVYLLSNYSRCVLLNQDSSGNVYGLGHVSESKSLKTTWNWVSLLAASLEEIPLVSLMYHLDASDEDAEMKGGTSGDWEDEEEAVVHENATGGSGVKLLEMRVLMQHRQIRRLEAGHWQRLVEDNAVDGLADVFLALTQSSNVRYLFHSALTDSGDTVSDDHDNCEMPMEVDGEETKQKPSSRNVMEGKALERIKMLLHLYCKILMACPPSDAWSSRNEDRGRAHRVRSAIEYSLAFAQDQQPLLCKLWNILNQSGVQELIMVPTSTYSRATSTSLSESLAAQSPSSYMSTGHSALYLLSSTFSYLLLIIGDDEFFLENGTKSLKVSQVHSLVCFLRDWLYRALWTQSALETTAVDVGTQLTNVQLIQSSVKLFNQLLHRNERRPFVVADDWLWRGIPTRDVGVEPDATNTNLLRFVNPKTKTVLSLIPQVISFKQRVSVFQQLVAADKSAWDPAQLSMLTRGIQAKVRRATLVQDAFQALNDAGKKIKTRIQVSFVSEQGIEEAGIDGGGLFKEFMDNLAKQGFDPTFGLFQGTSQQTLVPSPSSILSVVGEEHLQYFKFLGRFLGKAMYEGILIESQFAGVFLNALLGRQNTVDDLVYLDEQVYRSLMSLKRTVSEGTQVAELGLYFVANTEFGGHVHTTELIRGGSGILVTNENFHRYMHLLANFKLNLETRDQCRAFLDGCRDIIPVQWIRMFGPHELQLLIGGDSRRIDIGDMRSNCKYGGGYHESQPYIQAFWELLLSMSVEEQGDLLKFVTSCSRQPLLGFGQLNPMLCIQKVPTHHVGDDPNGPPRLPSAATCMNLLKLPQYDNIEQLREKLLYAIRSNSGFELS